MLVAHQHATVADDRIHAAAVSGVDEIRDEIVVRGESGLAKVDETEVGQVALGDAARAAAAARAGACACSRPKNPCGGASCTGGWAFPAPGWWIAWKWKAPLLIPFVLRIISTFD